MGFAVCFQQSKLLEFLKLRQGQQMPKLKFISCEGRIHKEEKIRLVVENLLTGRDACDAVIALTDVYTGTKDFRDAADAKAKMAAWVGKNPNKNIRGTKSCGGC